MNIILFEKDERTFLKDDDRYQHLKKVLKANEGSTFKGGIINGMSGTATITTFDDKSVSFTFTEEKDASSLYPITLVLAEVRPICMRRILRELVSLGVGRLVLVISDLGEKSYSSSSLYTTDEYEKIMIDGAMQSGFTGVPEVVFALNVEEAISLTGDGQKLLLDPKKGLDNLSEFAFNESNAILAIGPERGWSDREVDLFLKAGYTPLLMGKRILRTETAVVAGLSLTLAGKKLI